MFKRNLIAVSLAFAALASAQVSADVVGGGATLPQGVYQTSGVFPAGFAPYVGTGSGTGKSAFFSNNGAPFGQPVGSTVHYAGSDSVVSDSELDGYNAALYGPLVQIPSAATSVTVPFNVPGLSSLDLTSQQLAAVFAGQYTNWNQIPGLNGPNLPIRVVYRADGSGTTEIFLRHLKAAAPTVITKALDNDFVDVITPISGLHIPASGSGGVVAEVYGAGNEGSIGYVSPDYTEFGNAAKVARINGKLPTEAEVQAALATTPPPSGSATEDPRNWAPTFANPSAGYPIVGLTNLIFSQCYADTTVGGDLDNIQEFLTKHYNVLGANNDAVISNHKLIPLPATWKAAVTGTFVAASSPLSIGNVSVCNGIGR